MKISLGLNNIDEELLNDLIANVRQGRSIKSKLYPQLQAFVDSDYSYARVYVGELEYKDARSCLGSLRSRIRAYGFSDVITATIKDGIIYLVKKSILEWEDI